MLRVTDKSFQYTPSFETDLKKKFRKIAREKREAALNAKVSDAATAAGSSVVPLAARRIAQQG